MEKAESIDLAEAEAILKGLASMFAPPASGGSVNQAQRLAEVEALSSDLQAKYQTLVEQIPAVVFLAFLDRGISEAYISPQIEQILGFSQREWLNDPVRWYNRLHPDDKARWSMEAARLFLSGEPLHSVYRVMSRDGRTVWFRCDAKMVRHDDGRPWFIHGVAFDISDLKQAEADLRRAHDELEMRVEQRTAELARANDELQAALIERLAIQRQLEQEREILETVNRTGQMLASELDTDNLMQSLTDAATELTGAQFASFFYNKTDERGGSYMLFTLSGAPREQFADFPLPRVTKLFSQTFRGEGIVRIDDVRNDPRFGQNPPYNGMPPGHLPVASYLAAPVVSRSGEVFGGLFLGHAEAGIFDERSERIIAGIAAQAAVAIDNARLFAAEQKARKEAETANRLKDEFLATVSHELRTPLNAILGWAVMLRNRHLDQASVERALETIERNAKAQQQIIEDILDVSRIITGKLRIDKELVELPKVINAAVDSMHLAAEAKGVRLQAQLDYAANLVLGDANRLQQVIWNLISNAIKFTPRGGQVLIVTACTDSQAEIKVIDTGRGIKPEFLPYVFDRFRQEDSSSTRSYGGLGLGLAIVRHLVELHGGTVRADSEGDDMGATFSIKLPLAGAGANPQVAVRISPTGANDEMMQRLSGLKVLIVDDEADTRELVALLLEQYGVQVRAEDSASAALKTLPEWRPDVLISDIGMPIEDGYALIRKIRNLPPEHGGMTPAAALTAYVRREDRIRALYAGYQAHLPKPVESEELLTVIASLARRVNKP